MVRMKIEVNNSYLEELLYILRNMGTRKGVLKNTSNAIKEAALHIQSTWVDFASGGSLKGIAEPLKRPNGGYARSIKTEPTGPFGYEIYSEAKVAEWIENGTEELDMKTTHPYGPRSRVSKEGFPYVIIPFRWGTPGNGDGERVGFGKNVMTAGTHRRLLKNNFRPSTVTESPNKSSYKTLNYHGEMVGRAQYRDNEGNSTWGSRLETDGFMNGMVRFENGYDKKGNIGKRYGGYFTFRVISAKQLLTRPYSWIKPAMPARHVTRAVADATRKNVNEIIEAGLMRDVT
jgi:hypothetical protein